MTAVENEMKYLWIGSGFLKPQEEERDRERAGEKGEAPKRDGMPSISL